MTESNLSFVDRAIGLVKNTKFAGEELIKQARDLVSEHGENPQYDRALVELVSRALGLSDEHKDFIYDLLGVEKETAPEVKVMREYKFAEGKGFYEDDDRFHNKATTTVWALHMNVRQDQLQAVLDRMAMLPETTGEYSYGDSWEEWGEPAKGADDKHLTVYFTLKAYPPGDAPESAGDRAMARMEVAWWVGYHLHNHASTAVLLSNNTSRPLREAFAVSTPGDFAEQVAAQV